MIRTILRRRSITTLTIGITLIAVVLSLSITWTVHALLKSDPPREDLASAIIAPLVIAPLLSIQMLQLLSKLDEAEQRLEVLAFTDDLTQTYNRRYFIKYINQEFKRALRTGEAFSIAILDMDNFKQINDQWGHLIGDKVLLELSHILREQIRQADILARYGGDEFIFLFPRTDRQQIQIWADRVAEEFSGTSIQLGDLDIQLSFSVGMAVFDNSMHDVDDLLKKADDALYQAKRRGGNQIVFYQDQ